MYRLGFRVLRAVVSENSFEYAPQWDHNQMSVDRLYIQLVNLDYNVKGQPPGIRYIPNGASTVKITLPSIDASKVVSALALAAFPNDASIWYLDVAAADDFGSGNLVVLLTENSVERRLVLVNGVSVTPVDGGRCI